MILLDWLKIFYGILCGLAIILYLPRLIGFRYAFKKVPRYHAQKKRKISLVIPARNESAIIGDLFASIRKQTYDPAFYEVNVIVKDPNDPTVAIAHKLGARVFVVPDQKCKGDALDGYFKCLTPEEMHAFEAFVIVDADAVLDPEYVSALNDALETDHDIYLTRKFAKNFLGGKQNRSVFSNCSALTWPILDDLGNTYRMQRAMPLNLCGQGMMIRRRVIEELGGWPYRTLTEDYELKLDSLLRGYTSAFYPYAILYTEEALGHGENYTRRMRWLTGYKQCDKKYREKIRRQVRERGKYNAGEFEYFFGLFPPILFAAATAITIVFGIALTITYAVARNPLWFPTLSHLVAFPCVFLYVLLFAYSVLAMFACGEMFRCLTLGEKLMMLFYNPFYLLEYIPIYLRSAFVVQRDKVQGWKETERIHYDGLDKK